MYDLNENFKLFVLNIIYTSFIFLNGIIYLFYGNFLTYILWKIQ